MSDEVIIALITAVFGFLTAVLSLINNIQIRKTATTVTDIGKVINGNIEQLSRTVTTNPDGTQSARIETTHAAQPTTPDQVVQYSEPEKPKPPVVSKPMTLMRAVAETHQDVKEVNEKVTDVKEIVEKGVEEGIEAAVVKRKRKPKSK